VDWSIEDLDDPNDQVPPLEGGASAMSVDANVRVNKGNDNGKAQNEPYIVMNPSDSTHLVAGAIDRFYKADGGCGFYWSTDGGATWQRPNKGLPIDRDFQFCADPGLAFSPDLGGGVRRVYYSAVVFNQVDGVGTDGTIWVTHSRDGGATFPRAHGVRVASAVGDPTLFHDKSFTTVDPESGNVYVTWTKLQSTEVEGVIVPETATIQVARSTDNGDTFGDIRAVSPTEWTQGSLPFVGPGGVVYVIYAVPVFPGVIVSSLEMVSSTDGGLTWTAPRLVATVDGLPYSLPNTSFRVNSFPAAAVDRGTGRIYVAWADERVGNADIFTTFSSDGGFTWSTPQNLTGTNSNDQFFPWLSVDPNGNIDLVYYSRLDTTTRKFNLFHRRSTDGGLTFSAETQVNDGGHIRGGTQFGGEFIGDYIGVVSGAAKTHAVWMDTRRNKPNSNKRQQDVFSAAITP